MPPPHRLAGSADVRPSGSDSDSAPDEEFRRPAAASLEDIKFQRRMHLMESAGLSDSGEDASDSGDDLSDDDAADGRDDSGSETGESQEGSSDAGTSSSEEDAVVSARCGSFIPLGVSELPFHISVSDRDCTRLYGFLDGGSLQGCRFLVHPPKQETASCRCHLPLGLKLKLLAGGCSI